MMVANYANSADARNQIEEDGIAESDMNMVVRGVMCTLRQAPALTTARAVGETTSTVRIMVSVPDDASGLYVSLSPDAARQVAQSLLTIAENIAAVADAGKAAA